MNYLKKPWLLLCLALLLAASHGRADTVYWSDGFENSSHWEVNSLYVWTLGAPKSGPAPNASGLRVFDGNSCAFTAGYRGNTDSRLICVNYNGSSTLLVPTNGSPRLRFWHWFAMQSALGFVEISTNAGADWDQISLTYEDMSGGGVWSRPFIDLTPYAGQNVQIAFRFYGGGSGNALGWYIDDVEVDVDSPVENFPDGFEFDPKLSDWSVDYGNWEIGSPTHGPGAPHSGTNCAATVLAGSYGSYANTRLMSPWFAVPTNSPTLHFWHWYSFNNALGFVEINDGTTITTCVTNLVTTNFVVAAGLNTNIFMFTNAVSDPNYTNPFTYDPISGLWTNGLKEIGPGFFNQATVGPIVTSQIYYEGASLIPQQISVFGNLIDYACLSNAVPQSIFPTNFITAMQGTIWTNTAGGTNILIGCFGTNYVTTNSSMPEVSCTGSTWNQISPTWGTGTTAGQWNEVSLDLSAYAGDYVQIAFHFGSLNNAAPGWYVDDLSLSGSPELITGGDQEIPAGTDLIITNTAFNPTAPNATYTFKLLSAPAGMTLTNIASQGVLTWQTDPNQPASTNLVILMATDNSTPPLSTTNSFTVIVDNPLQLMMPTNQTIYAGQTVTATFIATNQLADSDTFEYSLISTLEPNMDDSDLDLDGVLNWPTLTTQTTGTYKIVIEAVDDDTGDTITNSFQVKVLPAPTPFLSLPAGATFSAGQTVTLTNIYATNIVFPNATYTYTLTQAPGDATIANGDGNNAVFTWDTPPTNRVVSFIIKLEAQDDNTPPLTVSGSFIVTLTPTASPSLKMPSTQTNFAGLQLSVAVTATNTSRPNATYLFSLPSASTNICVTNTGPATAMLTWTNTGIKNGVLIWTNSSVAPGTRTILVKAVDTGWSSNPVTNQFTMVFLPPHAPNLVPPTSLPVFAGQMFTNALCGTNAGLPGTNFTFALALPCTNGLVKTNGGWLMWTNPAARPGIYGMSVKVTDDSVPPVHGTNNVAVTVLPLPSQLAVSGVVPPGKNGKSFKFGITTPWTNTPWRVEASTNLSATNWLPIFTNNGWPVTGLFTDLFYTNFPHRYYRVVYP